MTARVFVDAGDEVAAMRVCQRFVDGYVRPECLGVAVHVHEHGRYYKSPEHFEFSLAIPIADEGLAHDLLPRLERSIGTGWVCGVCATNAGGKIVCESVVWISLGVIGQRRLRGSMLLPRPRGAGDST